MTSVVSKLGPYLGAHGASLDCVVSPVVQVLLVQHHAELFLVEGTYDRRAELLSASLRHCAAFLAAGHRINIFKADGG